MTTPPLIHPASVVLAVADQSKTKRSVYFHPFKSYGGPQNLESRSRNPVYAPLGGHMVIHNPLCSTCRGLPAKERTKRLASPV